jgi:hypothetical protein
MGTDSHPAPLPLRECKVRASLLLKELCGADAARARRAAERLRALPVFARLSPEEVVARGESMRHKHALAVIAHEQGFPSWEALKAARDEETPPRLNIEAFFARGSSAFLNRWFSTYDQALAAHRTGGGFLFPFRKQFFVCDEEFIRALGADPSDPDWEGMGRNWVAPLDTAARDRLERKLIDLGYAS